MSGKVPPSSRAGKPAKARSGYARAADLYERFTGHDAEPIGVVDVPEIPDTVATIGPCDAVCYTTIRDGVTERYIHEFAAKDRPLLCISPNGKQIYLIGGRYVFTDRGIVDMSDRKNLPAKHRR